MMTVSTFCLIYCDISVSGLSGSVETAQTQVSVGMGLLAGSTVMLCTVIWGVCVTVGKCDIDNSVAIDGKDTKGFSLTGLFFTHLFTIMLHYFWILNTYVAQVPCFLIIEKLFLLYSTLTIFTSCIHGNGNKIFSSAFNCVLFASII